jgi:hypothetical protein
MEVAPPASWSLGGPGLVDREGRRRQRTNLQSRGRCDGVGDGDGVGDDDGDTVGGVEAEGRVGDGVGDGDDAASREVASMARH